MKPNPSESVRKAKAEKWFNDNNKHVSRAQNAAFPDSRSSGPVTVPCGTKLVPDDPPFYLDQQSSSDIDSACAVPSDQSTEPRCKRTQRVLPTRSIRSRMDSRQSTSEEFRSVIDDLTVRNKKLRQKLKKYEELHCSILQEEKLFEVRIHSLPANKKCELEQTLRSFASSLRESPDLETLDTAPPQTSLVPGPLPLGKTSSSPWTSSSKRVDSAYASISATGQTMISQSTRNDARSIRNHLRSAELKRQNIKSFLHDVPQEVLPRISKKAKRQMVVRRLEELFIGKRAATSGSNQSLQQQEVSRSANSEAGGRRVATKDVREARILPPGVDFLSDPANDEQTMSQPQDSKQGSDLKSRGPTPSGGETPEQRPTNPLDLDLYRAQVPADNIQYIRHLGLASPMMNSDAASDQLDGWVYLNILTSMAQLHTLNVTTEFVRKSVADLSSIFELSTDGRKIRWKGSTEGTRMSSDGDSSAGEYGQSGSRRRRRVPGTEQSDVNDVAQLSNCNSSTEFGAGEMNRPVFLGQVKNGSDLHYQPLIFRGTRLEDDEDYSICSDDSLSSHDVPDDMTGADSNSRGPRGSRPRSNLFRPQRENGPIIFYNKAKFCTDLSGDTSGTRIDDISFTRFTDDPIGREMLNPRMSLDGPEKRLLHGSNRTGSAKAKSSVSSIMGSYLTMEQPEPSRSDHICKATEPMYLEASGLGGVQPRDNLVINVQVQHGKKQRLDHNTRLSPSRDHVRRDLPVARHKIVNLRIDNLRYSNLPTSAESTESLVEAKIISSRMTMLSPSTLPDPSYLCLPFSSDNEDDDEDDNNTTSEDDVRQKPSLVSSLEQQAADEDARGFNLASSSDEASQESSFVRTSEGSDDSSIDLLAHARVLDPDTIAAREREFDSNVGQPLAELPAGSSAATAGGGSGFPSECSSSSLTMEESRPWAKKRRMQSDGASKNVAASSGEHEESL